MLRNHINDRVFEEQNYSKEFSATVGSQFPGKGVNREGRSRSWSQEALDTNQET